MTINDLFTTQPAISESGELTYESEENANGTAMITAKLQDNGGTDNGGDNESDTVMFRITVTPVNDAPTLTEFSSHVETTSKNTEIEITFDELTLEGDEADVDGTVDAFYVKSVTTGSLKIGADAGSATAFDAVNNKTVNSTSKLYWTPANDAVGNEIAFTVVAVDNDGIESVSNINVTVRVTGDSPSSLTPFDNPNIFYQVIDGQLKSYNHVNGTYTNIGADQLKYNGGGYNIVDNFIYAIGKEGSINQHLLRIGNDGTYEDLGNIGFSTHSGDVDDDDNLWVYKR